MWRTTSILVGVCCTLAVATARPAAADTVGPTDYRTTITDVVPATPSVAASVHGGDSFLLLEVRRGSEVSVPGYRGEPFLEFAADGTVRANVVSYTHLLSEQRYGSELPADFDEDASPQWKVVATDGSFAWHDHRIHWMADIRPPGKRPGDVILRAVVPLTVDGVPVQLFAESTWLAAPSRVPVVVGLAIGAAAAGAAAISLFRRRRAGALPSVLLSGAATAAGSLQFRSLPSETGPLPSWWVLPTLATVVALAAAAVGARTTVRLLLGAAGLAVAGVSLTVWAWPRRSAWTTAVLPTTAPAWSDRATSAAALIAGAGTAAASAFLLCLAVISPQRVSSPRRPTRGTADRAVTSAG